MDSHRVKTQDGFTLIEVMVAILLAVLAVIGVMALFRVQNNAASFSRRETEAAVLAQDRLEVLRTGAAPAAGTTVTESYLDATGNVVSTADATHIYTRNSVITAPTGVETTYTIKVTVSWADDAITRSVGVWGRR
jgi:Tfp pilus assembly protein PilV